MIESVTRWPQLASWKMGEAEGGGYNTKEKLKWHVTTKEVYIPDYRSLLADGNTKRSDVSGKVKLPT
jgi:hypothetical protein